LSTLVEVFPRASAAEALVVFPGGTYSFAALWDCAGDLAAGLPPPSGSLPYLAFRVREPGELPVALLAAWRRGLALFPLAPDSPEEESILAQAGPPLAVWDGLPARRGLACSGPLPGPDAPALLLHTSGSTAAPKVFLFRHGELFAAAHVERSQIPGARRRILNLRPAFTSGGTNTIWPAFLAGETLLFAGGNFQLPLEASFRELVRTLSPSLVVASPAYLRALLLGASAGSEPLLSAPTALYFGGAHPGPTELRALHHHRFLPTMRYGMTECAHLLSTRYLGMEQLDEEPGGVGHPFRDVEVRVGSTLSFRAPGFASYACEAGSLVSVLTEGGWYKSDDRGSLTAAGSLFLEGRDQRQIVVSGFRVSGAEVEEVLRGAAGVKDVVVVGVPHPLLGQAIVAVVVAEGEDWEARVRAQVEGGLSAHKRPRRYIRVGEIPATLSGKRHWRKIESLAAPPVENLWEAHFALWKRLRKEAGWERNPLLRHLAVAYMDCLRDRLSDQRIAEIRSLLHAASGSGKHRGYQAVWGWNALAFQLFRFHGSAPAARDCLERAFQLVPSLVTGHSYGRATPCAESVWVILLLNNARLDLRSGSLAEGAAKIAALRKFVSGGALDGAVFGDFYRKALASRDYRFSRAPYLVEFLEKKLGEEEGMWLR